MQNETLPHRLNMKWDERKKKQREKMYFSIIIDIVYMLKNFKLFLKANDMFAIKKRITSTNYTIFQLNLHCIRNELVFFYFFLRSKREKNRAHDLKVEEIRIENPWQLLKCSLFYAQIRNWYYILTQYSKHIQYDCINKKFFL